MGAGDAAMLKADRAAAWYLVSQGNVSEANLCYRKRSTGVLLGSTIILNRVLRVDLNENEPRGEQGLCPPEERML